MIVNALSDVNIAGLLGQVWVLERHLVHLEYRKKELRWEAQQEGRDLDQTAYQQIGIEIDDVLRQIKAVEKYIAQIEATLN